MLSHVESHVSKYLTLTMLRVDSADDKLKIFFLFFLENRIIYFMLFISLEDSLNEVSNPIFLEK